MFFRRQLGQIKCVYMYTYTYVYVYMYIQQRTKNATTKENMFCVQVNFEISTADFNMPEEGKVVVYVNEVRYCVTRSCVRQGPVMCVT